ncbi:hypothetical protein SAMN05421686_105137 [Thalassolituus maritimus]|uniref:Uncharacterized protein n=1 Tax=Thalassolituus maritimus TaxID=484498 RepID=A0A1N7MEF3_9GAMM|nr:hypothetical protein [Thalassolituus maritimus]SIS84565.1 hypothetical protein SAMN05421686_105137 [Thalassolituus maritimus]
MLPELWVRALEMPALSVTTPYTLRINLARLLRTASPAEAAIIAGLRSDIPASAFLSAYQIAMRAVDPALPPEQWACLCVSEKGLRSLSEMETSIEAGAVSGRKSHAMLAMDGIDWLYVIARSTSGLICQRVSAKAEGVSPHPAKPGQPVIPELPHHVVDFTASPVDSAYLAEDAHQCINKPFRYHEDVMVLLAFAGWVLRVSEAHPGHQRLIECMRALADGYRISAAGYDKSQLDAFDALIEELLQISLPEKLQQTWHRDRQLLLMGKKARDIIRSRLA